MSNQSYAAVLAGMIVAAAGLGCNQPDVDSGPSYAELVVTYNAELAALDRLEAKRDELIEEFAAATKPSASGDSMAQLEDLLNSARNAQDDADQDEILDPNAQLDALIERNDEAQEIAGGLLDGLLNQDTAAAEPTPEEAAAIAEKQAQFEANLATLDAEIAKQRERVERAREARDAAEAGAP